MLAAPRVLWWAIVGIYDETLLLLKANLVWFLLSLPFAIVIFLALIPLVPTGGNEDISVGAPLQLMTAGLLLLLIPNPASLGMYQIAARMARKESPPWREFWDAVWRNVGLGLKLFLIGLVGFLVLLVNTAFYLQAEGLLQGLAFLWIYLGLFWLGMQMYTGPVAMYLGEERFWGIYRRAALLVLAHPLYSLVLLLGIALVMVLCLIAPPIFPALAMAFVALTATGALARLKRKYDPEADPDEEVV